MSMKYESEMIFRLIFAHYEQAMLLFYGSAGSALEHYFDVLVQKKIEESIIFFQKAGYGAIDEKLLGLLISVQFATYKRLIIDFTDFVCVVRSYRLGICQNYLLSLLI